MTDKATMIRKALNDIVDLPPAPCSIDSIDINRDGLKNLVWNMQRLARVALVELEKK